MFDEHHTGMLFVWVGSRASQRDTMIMALAKHGRNCKLHKAAIEVDKNANEMFEHKKQELWEIPIIILWGATGEQTLI